MSETQHIVFQPYLWENHTLQPGTAIACRTVEDGQRRMDKARAGLLSLDGAVLVRMAVDEELGDYGEPEYLATMGDIPGMEDDMAA